MWRSSERSRSEWDGEFESPFLQRRVRKLSVPPSLPARHLAIGEKVFVNWKIEKIDLSLDQMSMFST
jgi:hypothetical protein